MLMTVWSMSGRSEVRRRGGVSWLVGSRIGYTSLVRELVTLSAF
jgi:hypothetical protein